MARLDREVDEFGQGEQWSEQMSYHIKLALEEVVMNVISYAYDDDSAHEFEVRLCSNSEGVVIDVIDDGRPFDPLHEAAEPDVEATLEARNIGGLGVFFVKTLMDDVEYRPRKRPQSPDVDEATGRNEGKPRRLRDGLGADRGIPVGGGAAAGRSGGIRRTAIRRPGADVAATGVTENHIVFGQSAAFSGPAAELGTHMRLGIRAAFAEANRAGGVHGRRLDLVSLDDAYEPETAVVNTQRLIGEHRVFALIGAVGTPTSRSAAPVAAAAGIPYVAPFTGAAFLRDAAFGNVVNLRASYGQETEEMVERLIRDLGIRPHLRHVPGRFLWACRLQGSSRGLGAAVGMEPVSTGVYPRNTTAVKTGLLDIRKTDPGAVILVGAYQPVAAFIKWARHTGFDPCVRDNFVRLAATPW